MPAAASLPPRKPGAEPASAAPLARAAASQPAPLPAANPPWMYRSEAFAEDFDERTLPGGMASPLSGKSATRRGLSIWPWAVGVPLCVLALGLVIALSAA